MECSLPDSLAVRSPRTRFEPFAGHQSYPTIFYTSVEELPQQTVVNAYEVVGHGRVNDTALAFKTSWNSISKA